MSVSATLNVVDDSAFLSTAVKRDYPITAETAFADQIVLATRPVPTAIVHQGNAVSTTSVVAAVNLAVAGIISRVIIAIAICVCYCCCRVVCASRQPVNRGVVLSQPGGGMTVVSNSQYNQNMEAGSSYPVASYPNAPGYPAPLRNPNLHNPYPQKPGQVQPPQQITPGPPPSYSTQ